MSKAPMLMWMRAILIAWLSLSGCTGTTHVHIEIKPVLERKPLIASLPLTIGVYLTPEFRAYHATRCGNGAGRDICLEYDLGPQSVELFEKILTALFDDVVVIDSMPPKNSSVKIAGIVVPAITQFKVGSAETEITYRATLHNPDGTELGAWDVYGSAGRELAFSDQARLAMRSAAAKFVKGFRNEPVVMRWLEDGGIKSSDAKQSQSPEGDRP
jgi:hypothetical protein